MSEESIVIEVRIDKGEIGQGFREWKFIGEGHLKRISSES